MSAETRRSAPSGGTHVLFLAEEAAGRGRDGLLECGEVGPALLEARVETPAGRQQREHTAEGKGRDGKWEGKRGNREVGRKTGKSCNASQGSCRDASGSTAAGTYS